MKAVPDLIAAAAWLIKTRRAERGGAAVPILVKRFGPTREQAISIIRENNLRLARAT